MERGLSAQEIADRLDTAVRRRGITYAQVARAAGVSPPAVSLWFGAEGERDLVQWRRLSAVCRELGLSADEILGITPPPDPGPSRVAIDQAVGHLVAALRALLGDTAVEDIARKAREMLESGTVDVAHETPARYITGSESSSADDATTERDPERR